jgi:hypothetical protein
MAPVETIVLAGCAKPHPKPSTESRRLAATPLEKPMTASKPKFLLVYRQPFTAVSYRPSPADRQQMLAQGTQ